MNAFNLKEHELTVEEVYRNLPPSALYEHAKRVWLVNPGWSGGAYGTGKRIKLAHTRAIVDAKVRSAGSGCLILNRGKD